VFDRYHIVAASDLTEAAARLEGVTGYDWRSGEAVATVEPVSRGRERRKAL
jgi:hypothetical protein